MTDKRKIKKYGFQEPPGRIRKTLLAEVRQNTIIPMTGLLFILPSTDLTHLNNLHGITLENGQVQG